jgi:hypothetical protein
MYENGKGGPVQTILRTGEGEINGTDRGECNEHIL